MTFRVGQKVVCVAGPCDTSYEWSGRKSVCVGSIYTIREIKTDVQRPQYGVGLLLEEVINPLDDEGEEPGFYSCRFRPVTDISFAHEILRKVTRKDRVKA